jgi:hypothetical protein
VRIGQRIGPRFGPRINYPGFSSGPPTGVWTSDATSHIAIPQNSAEWIDYMAMVNYTLSGLGEAALPAKPDFCLLCQDAAGNPTDVLNGRVFTASGTGLTYNVASSGWSTKALTTFDNATGTYRCTDAALPDMSTGAVSLFSWCRFVSSTGASRSLMALGTTTVDYIGGQTVTRVNSGASTAAGAANRQGSVVPFALVGDRLGSRVVGYDDTNKVTPVSSALVTGKGIAIGAAPGVVNSATAAHHFVFGFYSALTDLQVKTVMQTAGWTITWS